MMSSPESLVATVEDESRARSDGRAHEAAHRVVRIVETQELATRIEAPRQTRVLRSETVAARWLMLLHFTPLLGVAGVIALYWSSGGPRDIMFAVGMLLLLSAVAAFQQLRTRLVASLAVSSLREGLPDREAYQRAELAADKLIRASLFRSHAEAPKGPRQAGGGPENRPTRWPPISLG